MGQTCECGRYEFLTFTVSTLFSGDIPAGHSIVVPCLPCQEPYYIKEWYDTKLNKYNLRNPKKRTIDDKEHSGINNFLGRCPDCGSVLRADGTIGTKEEGDEAAYNLHMAIINAMNPSITRDIRTSLSKLWTSLKRWLCA